MRNDCKQVDKLIFYFPTDKSRRPFSSLLVVFVIIYNLETKYEQVCKRRDKENQNTRSLFLAESINIVEAFALQSRRHIDRSGKVLHTAPVFNLPGTPGFKHKQLSPINGTKITKSYQRHIQASKHWSNKTQETHGSTIRTPTQRLKSARGTTEQSSSLRYRRQANILAHFEVL